MLKKLLGAATLLSATFFLACSEPQVNLTGGVSEETNTLAGVIKDSKGNTVANAVISAQSFDVDTLVLADTSDSEGKFKIMMKRPGSYGVFTKRDGEAFYDVVNFAGDDIALDLELSEVTQVSGVVQLRQDTTTAGIKVALPGSPWTAESDSQGVFVLEDVPMGKHILQIASPDPIRFMDAAFVLEVSEKGYSFVGPLPVNASEESSEGIDTVETLVLPRSPEYGLLSWYPMDFVSNAGGSSLVSSDARGRSEGLLIYGVDSLEEGLFNNALVLRSAKQFGVVENDRGAMDSLEAFTLEAWVYIDTIMTKDSKYRKNIIGKVGFGGDKDQDVFSLAAIKGECGAKKSSFAFFIASGAGDTLNCDNVVVADSEIEFGKWVNLVAVWDGENVSLYQNGVLSNSAETSVKQLLPSSESIFFGKEDISLRLDDVRLSSTAVSAADVLYRYHQKGGAK